MLVQSPWKIEEQSAEVMVQLTKVVQRRCRALVRFVKKTCICGLYNSERKRSILMISVMKVTQTYLWSLSWFIIAT